MRKGAFRTIRRAVWLYARLTPSTRDYSMIFADGRRDTTAPLPVGMSGKRIKKPKTSGEEYAVASTAVGVP